MSELPKFVIRLTHDEDDCDAWDVLQRCAGGANYYVTMWTVDSLPGAEQLIAELEAEE